ncbi:MAG: YfhO family protein [Chloroflexi bacterium]|nr:YfhO family protein [Chloroflexota bacterium]
MEKAFERRPYWVPVVLALLTLLFMRPAVLPPNGEVLAANDFRAMFYPLTTMLHDMVQAGELPLWNPYTFIGHPLIGNPHSALFYPATWLIMLIGADRGVGLALAFHVWLAAWGMARLMRGFGATHTAGLLAGVVFGMSEWMGTRFYAGHYTLIMVAAWIPWAVAGYHFALKRGTWLATIPAGAALGMALLGGHPPMVFYLGLSLVVMLVWHTMTADDTVRAFGLALRQLVVLGIIGAVLGAALLIPALELTRLSVRDSNDIEFINSFALPPAQFLGLALPGLFGNPNQAPTYYWGRDFYEEFSAYVGLLPLLALPLAFRRLRREHLFFIGLIVLGVLMSVGLQGAILPIVVRWIPGFSFFRAPGRALFFVMFGLAGLLALLISTLQHSIDDERREFLQPILSRWLPIGMLVAFGASVFFSGWYASASHVEPMPTRALMVAGALAAAGIVLAGLWAALSMWTRDASPPPSLAGYQQSEPANVDDVGRGGGSGIDVMKWALPVLAFVVILDAWRIPLQLINTTAGWRDSLWEGAAVNIKAAPDARVLEIPEDSPYNGGYVTRHQHVIGYDPLPIATFDKLQKLGDLHDPMNAANTLVGVKYLLAKTPYDRENFELIGIAEGGIYYRRTDPFPRVWFATNGVTVEPNDDAVRETINKDVEALRNTAIVDSPLNCATSADSTAEITDYHPTSVTINTGGGGGVLVLSDQYYPGWEAAVDGQSVSITRAFTALRAVCVPAGEHTVTFVYRPMSLILGLALTVVGWLVVSVVWFIRKPYR